LSERSVRQKRWRRARTAPDANQAKQFFIVTHPFHPWRGQRLELIDYQRRWGQWRVYFLSSAGTTGYLPAAWTDVGPKDPFVEQSQGRAIARVEDLLELVKMTSGAVNEIKPQV
jgi:Family of unknown function (DUF5372)